MINNLHLAMAVRSATSCTHFANRFCRWLATLSMELSPWCRYDVYTCTTSFCAVLLCDTRRTTLCECNTVARVTTPCLPPWTCTLPWMCESAIAAWYAKPSLVPPGRGSADARCGSPSSSLQVRGVGDWVNVESPHCMCDAAATCAAELATNSPTLLFTALIKPMLYFLQVQGYSVH